MLDCDATFKLMTTGLRFISLRYRDTCRDAWLWISTPMVGPIPFDVGGSSVGSWKSWGLVSRVRVVFMTILPLISMEFCILDIFLCPEIARETVDVFLGVPLVHSLSGYLWLVQWVLP